jgi:F-type H+-transporting ATPase subunit b
MPQFDITTFSSQVFWFAICFSVLYYFVSSKILPRIRDIAKDRQDVIDTDLSAASKSEKESEHLQNEIDSLRTNAAVKYQESLDQTSKTLAKQRENEIESLKKKSKKM